MHPHTHVMLTFPANPILVLQQQGVNLPVRDVIRDKAGAPRGLRLEEPFDDVALMHGAPITRELRSRMRQAIRHHGGTCEDPEAA